MQLADLLSETLESDSQDVWENKCTPTPVRRFGVRLHTAGLSIRETVAILDLLGIDRSHGAVWNWVHTLSEAQSDPPTATPSRVAVDEKQIKVDGEPWTDVLSNIHLNTTIGALATGTSYFDDGRRTG